MRAGWVVDVWRSGIGSDRVRELRPLEDEFVHAIRADLPRVTGEERLVIIRRGAE